MPSAVIKSYHYDAGTQIFEVIYHSGKVYHYLGVPENEYRQFKATMVKGIWFNKHIKGKYPFKDVTPGMNQSSLF
ncbi:KTSC domain-containing protein [Mucilaginibacter segetis]|uniref:KTSC domain-containing protein n=1 Tax=Mucilaginibacter segetis TaxID=2793071 RepID=A0A934PTG5_9SPHI|nr:KTSC domain-containing protein [Mucilaginibacter segetis]MBK0379242.1 KTSC domain-containing protein [Mucilaginibacter segetis]